MKKLLTILMITININAFSQPFVSFQGNTIGVNVAIGYLHKTTGIGVEFGYNKQFFNNHLPDITYLRLNKNLQLGNDYLITPSIGIAKIHKENLNKYNDDGGEIEYIKKATIFTSIEFGKNNSIGELFLCANYCNVFYFGAGIKAFIK